MPTSDLVPSTTSEHGWHDVWLEGRKEGEKVGERRQREKIVAKLEELQDLQERLSDANRTQAQIMTQLMFTGLLDLGVGVMQAFLRQNAIDEIDVIVSVSEKDFADPSFDEAMERVETIRQEYARENFSFDVSYLPISGDLNSDALLADGYDLWYTPET